MRTIEYYKELRAFVGHRPLILPGSVVIIANQSGEILLQHRREGSWGLPGGLMELGESLEDTAKREVFEEAGIIVRDLKLIGVFSGPQYYCKIENGDEFYSVTALYTTKEYAGEIKVEQSESKEFRFFSPNDLPGDMSHQYKDCIEAYLRSIT